jgi:hypothetical protein
MTSYYVYRITPGRPAQYIRRIVGNRPLWTTDASEAQPFSQRDAERWRDLSSWRTENHPTARASERPGEYSMEVVE